MTIGHHDLSREQFRALARGGSDGDALARLVAAQLSRHMILLRGVLMAALSGDNVHARLALAGYELLARVQRDQPGAASDVIRYPSVGAWALHSLRAGPATAGSGPGGLAAVAAAAAIRAKVPARIEVPVTGGRVMLPSLGSAIAEGVTAVVSTSPAQVRSGDLTVRAAPGSPGWQELRPLRAGALSVLVDDLDPFRMPASDGEATGRLSGPQLAELATALREAWEVLDPASAAEIAALVRVIVPFQAPEAGFVSTTSSETFGTIALSRQPDRHKCAETLVHETQHLKLCALLDLVTLTRPDDGRRYYAPWREDPRPASALLQGAYAFLGVCGFWRQQRQAAAEPEVRQRADADFARWRASCSLAVGTLLASGQLTVAGQEFAGQMARTLEAWQREPVSAGALATASRKSSLHWQRWRTSNDGGAVALSPGLT